jgi:hypothetical protein
LRWLLTAGVCAKLTPVASDKIINDSNFIRLVFAEKATKNCKTKKEAVSKVRWPFFFDFVPFLLN